MKLTLSGFALLLLGSGASFGPAKADESFFQDQAKVIRAPHAASVLGADLFGDKINLYHGGLEFNHADVSLPGNNALPVMVGRRMVAGSETYANKQFGNWDLEIPHLHGTYTTAQGWTIAFPPSGSTAGSRCTQFAPPPSVPGAGAGTPSNFTPDEYWHGHFLYIPGQGDQELLRRNVSYTDGPKDGQTYPVVTQRLWSLRCLPSLANDTTPDKAMGEGFIAVSPDGTQYRFDWMATRMSQTLYKPGGTFLTGGTTETMTSGGGLPLPAPSPSAYVSGLLPRSEVWIMPTMVTDRFGNTVSYTYNAARPWQLTTIHSSDNRTITLQYVPGTDQISSVYDGTRTWNYAYNTAVLDTVTLPDASTWQLYDARHLQQKFEINSDCGGEDILADPDLPALATLVHPSGAAGTFALTPTTHGRSWVPQLCRGSVLRQTSYALRPIYVSTLSLTHKTITGPGLQAMDWAYDYGTPNASWAPCDGCAETSTTTVTDPKGNVSTYTFGNRYNLTEGQLQNVEVRDANAGVLRTTSTHYRASNAGPYPIVIGSTGQARGDGGMSEVFMPQDQQVITQQGATFSWQATAFDTRARATTVTKSSSLGYSRSETTVFADSHPTWTPYVLGLIESVTEGSGKVMVFNTYHPTAATLLTTSKFGRLEQTQSYYADGTLNTHKDGRSNTTTFSNYMRGTPQNVSYADAKSESAVVNNMGTLDSLTNAAGFTTSFKYDAMGRIAQVTYPVGGTVTWNPTTVTFSKSLSSQYGLPAGHWRQVVQTGNAVATTYYDALWRAVYSEQSDSTDVAGTARIVENQYDHDGHTTFQSYPQRSYGQISGGVRTQFDALGRMESSVADSELGPLITTTSYPGGFMKSVTDPRNHTTSMAYQAFDQPNEEAIVSITAQESVSVAIARDQFGKAMSITRSGLGKSATRSYVYDATMGELLCKTIEPETGATVVDYDAANNVAWRATGLALPSTTSCDKASVATAKKMVFGYDARNRLQTTTFGDLSPSISRTYTGDGLLETITSNGSVWTYTYNNRRLNEHEGMAYGGATYNIDRKYDANGSLSQLIYPVNSLTLAYNPNALGEPRQVGSYATGITYHPNGAIAGFTYGNGVKHTLLQNARGLPQQSTDAGVLNDVYAYDGNANVASITDAMASGTTSRTMDYDNLDRLRSVSAPGMWGNASYSYDTLDNLASTTITSGTKARSTVHNFDPLTNRLTSVSNGPTAFNFSYGYDAQGNITQRGSQAYVFDQGNRMSSATGKATYLYDGLGHRVSVVGTDNVNRVQVYSQGGQLLWAGPTGSVGTKYIYLHKHVIAEVNQ